MSKIGGSTKVEFRSLPPQIRRQIKQQPLLVQAQRRYLQSGIQSISNETYWAKIGESFETNKLEDHSLDPHIHVFLDRLANPAKSVIEFGCGIGRAADVLNSRGFRNYTGIDVCERTIEIARERLPDLEFETSSILTYKPREGRKFEASIATDVLLYLSPEEQIKALLNLNNALKEGSPIILRWAPGKDVVLPKEKNVEGERIEGWVFLASKKYIEEILGIAGFSLTQPIREETVTINPGTAYVKQQKYLVIFAKKARE